MVSASITNDTRKAVDAVEAGRAAVDPTLGAPPHDKGAAANGHHNLSKGAIPDSIASIKGDALFSLSQTGAIVTGGARGLGLCVAQSLIEAGSPFVYCVDILPSPAEAEWELVTKVAEEKGAAIEYRRLDITDVVAVGEVFEALYEACPVPIAAFFGAAGIQQMVPALDYTAADFRRVMDVNVTAARQMVKRRIRGSIVITASMSGSIANKGLTCLAYNTSKSALLQMCRSAAAEWGSHGIRVNTLSPGYILTAMTDQLLAERPDLDEEWLRGSMLGRLSTPDEFRGPVIFLLSQASSFVTGADLIVDGGHTAY